MAELKVSAVHRCVEAFRGEEIWIGVDVHKRSYRVGLLRPDGMVKDWTCPADNQALVRTILSLPVRLGAVCYEAGPTGFGLARALEAEGIPVVIAAPSRVPRWLESLPHCCGSSACHQQRPERIAEGFRQRRLRTKIAIPNNYRTESVLGAAKRTTQKINDTIIALERITDYLGLLDDFVQLAEGVVSTNPQVIKEAITSAAKKINDW